MTTEPYRVFFDSECILCRNVKILVSKLDKEKKIHFIPLSPESLRPFPLLDYQECQETIHMLTPSLHIFKGQEVMDELMQLLPGLRKISWPRETKVGKRAMELFYQHLAKARTTLKKCDHCQKKWFS